MTGRSRRRRTTGNGGRNGTREETAPRKRSAPRARPVRETPGPWDLWLREVGPRIERALDSILPSATERPPSIHRAMRYSVFTGGKRIRPALAAAAYRLAGGNGDAGVRLGASLELIHTFSLIHDDLPCMDDDDYRRGKLTCHRKFGEAIAVLAGDALQVLAFEEMARLEAPAARKLRVIAEITQAVGTAGVIGGQVVDIESEGRKITPAVLGWMHEHKTGALIRASLTSGALLAGGGARLVRRFAEFGAEFGLLFQIVDDLLNELGSYRVLGRRRGRDRVLGKATYPSIVGVDASRDALASACAACLERIPCAGADGDLFVDLVGMVVGRLPEAWLSAGGNAGPAAPVRAPKSATTGNGRPASPRPPARRAPRRRPAP